MGILRMMEVKRLAKSHSAEHWQSADAILMARKCPHGSPDALSLVGILDGMCAAHFQSL